MVSLLRLEPSSLEISKGTSPKGGNPNMTNLRISEVAPLLGLELMNDDEKNTLEISEGIQGH